MVDFLKGGYELRFELTSFLDWSTPSSSGLAPLVALTKAASLYLDSLAGMTGAVGLGVSKAPRLVPVKALGPGDDPC